MRKILRRIGVCLILVCLVFAGLLIADRKTLRDELIRLHVVAASDSEEDQAVKLRVRDAILESLRSEMENLADMDQARAYLQENLPKLERIANETVAAAGLTDTVSVSLCLEEFSTRVYDTFTLPAGLYESLRIVIGDGEGKNWWCVVFPSLCIPATSAGFEDAACAAGLTEDLAGTLTGEYEIRFFLLDALGKLENLLHRG